MSGSGRILVRSFRKEWRALGIATVATILVTLAELAGPVPLALVIDRVLEKSGEAGGFELTNGDLWLLAAAAGMLLGIALVQGVVSYFSDVSLTRAAERIVHDLRLATHVHLQRLSLLFHARRHTGDLVTRVTGDVNAVGTLFSESLASTFSAVLLLAGMVVVSVIIDPVLALVAFAGAPLLGLVSFHASRKLKQASRAARKRDGEIASLTAESFAAIREVKAFGSEPYEHGRLRSKSEERLHAGYDVTRIQSRFARTVDLIGSVGTAAVLVVGVFRVAGGVIGPGELVVMVAYASKMYRPLRTIAKQAGRISNSMARAERITEILAADDMLEERPGAYDGPPAAGAVELDSVSFAYEPGRPPALVNASLRVEAGTRLALVGRSGAGKSTVAAMIARFYDPTSGRVLIDGRDVRDCSLTWLRRQVGLVLQDTVLFSGSVVENIAYGLEVGQEEVEAAAKAAGAHGFISELPLGYETELGPRGIGLSGGQRQRIAIARTILRDPAILILDEPTTGLDAESEAHVLDALSTLMQGRTTIIVSHSPRLIEHADRAISIENGRIVGSGPTEPTSNLGVAAKKLMRTVAERVLVPGAAPPATPARTNGSAPGARVPDDPALPRLPALLDPDAMAPVLQRSLGSDTPLRDVRVHYIRYVPGAKAVVQYDVGLDRGRYAATAMIAAGGYLARRAAKPASVALARLVDGRSPALTPLSYEPELDVLVQWYPLDLELPALAEQPTHLLEELEEAGVHLEHVADESVTLKYRPRRRAVLRVGEHVLKVYSKDADFATAATALRLAGGLGGLRTAELEGTLPDRRVTVQSLLSGSPPSNSVDVATGAGELLRELHRLGAAEASARAAAASLPSLPGLVDAGEALRNLHPPPESSLTPMPPSEQLAGAEASARFLGAILPSLAARLDALVRELEAGVPPIDRLVVSHGDFIGRQLLVTADGLAVVDLDAMCLAPAALDPAMYAANVVSGEPDDLAHGLEVLERLLEGYARRPDGLSWYFATCALRHAMSPFRYLDEHWPERVEGIVAAAETSLDPR